MTDSVAEDLLVLDRVRFRYPDGGVALDGCSLAIARGSRNALIGPNGSGKTTLFHHVNGLLRPQSGEVRYAGKAVDYGRSGLRRLRSKVGMVFQNPDRQLFSASVREDVSFGPCNLGLAADQVRQRVDRALQTVGMAAFADKVVHNLSFGQKKRVCIAGVLAMEPELLILDEPMAGLDHAMQEELLLVLEDLHRRGITLLLATHDMDFAYRWSDRIHLMASGVCSAAFPSAELDAHAAALTAIGQPLPAVLPLQQQLSALGIVLPAPAARSCAELSARLTAMSLASPNPPKGKSMSPLIPLHSRSQT